MREMLRILIVLLIVATLPLRGYAAAAAELCAGQHGGAQSEHAADHDHSHDSTHDTGDADHSSTPSICSHCASCSVGASLAPDSARRVTALAIGAGRIPFFDARKPGYVPDHPERPPLVS